MTDRVLCLIGFVGLNICLLAGQEDSWERHISSARNLHAQALYKEAEKEYQAALRDAEAFGPEDTRWARTWNNLATIYKDQGRYVEAETLFRRAVAFLERLGPETQDLSFYWNNLAALYQEQGRYAEA